MSPRPIAVWIVRLTIAVLLLLGLAGLAGSRLLQYERVKPVLDALADTGGAEFYTAAFHQRILGRTRLAALVLLAVAVALVLGRGPASRGLTTFLTSLRINLRALLHDLAGMRADGAYLWGLLAITLFGLVLRLAYLSQPMRTDEAYTVVQFASRPWYVMLSYYGVPNNHVFHTVLVAISTRLFGLDPWAVRLPVLLAGVLTIPATYVVGRAFYGRAVGLVGAGLVSSSSLMIEYSTNARGYALVALIFLLLLVLAAYVTRHSNWTAWALMAVLSALGFYTVPTMLYPFGVVMTWLALAAFWQPPAQRRAWWLRILGVVGATLGLTVVLYLPILITSGPQVLLGNRFVQPLPWQTFGWQLPRAVLAAWQAWNRDIPWPVAILLAVGLAVSLTAHRKQARTQVPLALTVVLWCLPVLVVQRVAPEPRVWLFLVPLYWILVSAGLIWLVDKITATLPRQATAVHLAAAGLVALVLAGWVASSTGIQDSRETGLFADGERVTLFLQERLQPGDAVVSIWAATPVLQFYFLRHQMPTDYLYAPVNTSTRAYVVANHAYSETAQQVLLTHGVAGGVDASAMQVVQRFPSSSLYLLRPVP